MEADELDKARRKGASVTHTLAAAAEGAGTPALSSRRHHQTSPGGGFLPPLPQPRRGSPPDGLKSSHREGVGEEKEGDGGGDAGGELKTMGDDVAGEEGAEPRTPTTEPQGEERGGR